MSWIVRPMGARRRTSLLASVTQVALRPRAVAGRDRQNRLETSVVAGKAFMIPLETDLDSFSERQLQSCVSLRVPRGCRAGIATDTEIGTYAEHGSGLGAGDARGCCLSGRIRHL